jgi:hypothetical protein
MALQVSSPIPAVFQAGFGQDMPYQPLFECGNGNPAFYHQWFDDFDENFHNTSGNVYTLTGTGTPTLTSVSGIGGQATLSTADAVADAYAQMQLGSGSVGQFTINGAPKKLFWEMRFPASTNTATSNWVMGLCPAGTAAITAGTGAANVANGIYFYYVGSTGVLTLNVANASTIVSVTVPTSTFSTASTFDIAFFQNRQGDILGYVDEQLVGYVPQSLIGDTGGPQNAGATARILGTAYTAPATVLAPTVTIWQSSTAIATLTMDFMTVSQER